MLPKTANGTTTVVPRPEKEAKSYSSSGLRTPGLLARWPIIGLMMVLIGVTMFGMLAISLETHSPLLQTDTQIVTQLHQFGLQSSPLTRNVLGFGFYLGEHFILAIGALLALYFLYKRFWPELTMVVIAWLGEGGIWLVLSQYFNRPRPTFSISFWTQAPGPGFPSGHTFSAVMCYGLLAYLLVPKIGSRIWKVMVILTAVLVILYIGFSRVFVGDHYPTDVLAGYGLGVAWSGLAYTLVELISRKMTKHKEQNAA